MSGHERVSSQHAGLPKMKTSESVPGAQPEIHLFPHVAKLQRAIGNRQVRSLLQGIRGEREADRSQDDVDTRDPALEQRIESSRAGGVPLPGPTRTGMESAFGADFSMVRVHADQGAAQLAKDLGARAFAT